MVPGAAGQAAALLRGGFAIALVLGVAACLTPSLITDAPFSERAENVLASGYSHVATRYIDEVDIEKLALDGMRGITNIDAAIDVQRVGTRRVRLSRDGESVREFSMPPDDDPDSWAALTVAVVEASQQASPLIQEAPAENIYEAVFDNALAGLDAFTRYASAADARDQRAARQGFGGIGVVIRVDDEIVRIVSVMREGPAFRKGVLADDRILAVDGEEMTQVKLRDVIDHLRGPIESQVVLTLERESVPGPFVISVRRELIVPPTVVFEAVGDIAVLRMSGFNQHTAESLSKAIHEAQQKMGRRLKGMVLDLRANPGGLLDQAVSVSDEFLNRGQIVFTRGRHPDSYQSFSATYGDVARDVPMVVLINGSTASASEIVAAALQDQGRAVVIGTTSYGKGTVQTVHRLPNDGELVITWSQFHAPSGYSLNHLGVLPNICTGAVAGLPVERPEQVLQALDAGQLTNQDVHRAWRAKSRPSEDVVQTLRSACPPRQGGDDIELHVARRILEDSALYARVLKLSTAQVARR